MIAKPKNRKPAPLLGRPAAQKAAFDFAAIVNSSKVAIMSSDLEGNLLSWNKGAESIYGFSAREALGKPFLIMVPPEREGEARLLITRLLRGETISQLETVRRRKGGAAIDVSLTLTPIRAPGGRVIGFAALSQDITQRKSVERNLAAATSLLRAALDSTADGILVVDTAGKITSFNRKFAQLWRLPKGVLAAKDDTQAIAYVLDQLQSPEAFIKKIKELYTEPEAESLDLLEFKDGRVFERFSHPQRLGNSIVGRVWSFRDVTAAKKAEIAMAAANVQLQEKVAELERMNEIMMGREERILELKARIAVLERQAATADPPGSGGRDDR